MFQIALSREMRSGLFTGFEFHTFFAKVQNIQDVISS